MKVKSTKRALLVSGMVMLLCLSMLIGTTFAWFTDSVTSKNNIIKSGNLDVVLEYSRDGETWTEVEEDTALFSEDALWEPGHTEAVALRIRNAGTLALKYELATTVYQEVEGTNVYGDKFLLSDYLQAGHSAVQQDGDIGDVFMAQMTSSREAARSCNMVGFNQSIENPYPVIYAGDAHVVALVVTMPETVGNEANYLTGTDAPFIKFGVTLLATQQTSERDSFGNDYDAGSTMPEYVYGGGELNDALANGGDAMQGDDLNVDAGEGGLKNQYDKSVGIIVDGGTYDGNGKTLTVDGDYAVLMYGGTVKNLTISGTGATRGIMLEKLTKDVVIDNVTIDGPGYVINTTEGGSGTLTVKNSTLRGWTSIGNNNVTSVLYENTTFGENTLKFWQNNGYGQDYDRLVRSYVTTEFNGCTFEEDFVVDLSMLVSGQSVTFINCKGYDGTVLTAANYSDYIQLELQDAHTVTANADGSWTIS